MDSTGNTKNKDKKHNWIRPMLEFTIKTIVTIVILWILLTFVLGVFVCHNNRGYPMVKDGDLCITYRLSELKQGQLIVYQDDNGDMQFGRIIALPGNVISCQNDKVIVDGYEYFDNTVYSTSAEGVDTQFPHEVSANCAFVLNDYRSDMNDSRRYGDISFDRMEGTVIFIMRRRGI